MTTKIAALFIFDDRENHLLSCDSGGDPDVISGLVSGLSSQKEFKKMSTGKSILKVDGRKVYCVRTDNKVTAGCVASVDQKRERQLFACLHRIVQFPEVQTRPFQSGNALDRKLETEARSLEKEKKDIVEKNQLAVSQVSDKVGDMIQKEYDKHRKLLEVEDEVNEIEVVTRDNQNMATEIKYRSFWEDMKMNAILYGSVGLLALLLLFIAIKLVW